MTELSNRFAFLSRRLFQLTFGALLAMVLVSSVGAQSRAAETNTIAGNEEIHGTIKFPPGDSSAIRPTVVLRSLSSPEVRALANEDGEFRFSHLRPDHYTVVIDAGDGYEKATETVSVGFSGAVPAQGNPFSYNTPAVYEVRIYLRPKGLGDSAAAT